MQPTFYKRSGKFSSMFFVYFLLGVAISIPILAVAYIYLNHYIPFIYANIFIAIGCGVGLGAVVGFAGKYGKVRNMALMVIFAFIAMVVLKYVQWAVYIPLIFTNIYEVWEMTFVERKLEAIFLLTRPLYVFEGAEIINEFGVWGLGTNVSTAVTGIPLLLVWVAEFIILTASAILTANYFISNPFSEETGAWYSTYDHTISAGVPEHLDSIKQDMEYGKFDSLLEQIRQHNENPDTFLGFTIFAPPEQATDEPHFLTMVKTTVTTKGKGRKKDQTKTDTLLTELAVSAETVQAMEEAATYAAAQAELVVEQADE